MASQEEDASAGETSIEIIEVYNIPQPSIHPRSIAVTAEELPENKNNIHSPKDSLEPENEEKDIPSSSLIEPKEVLSVESDVTDPGSIPLAINEPDYKSLSNKEKRALLKKKRALNLSLAIELEECLETFYVKVTS